MLRLETFGGLTLRLDQGERPQPRRRLALLARLAPSGTRGVSRDELLALFWPERDVESARHSLDQLLYEMRRSLGASPTTGAATLRVAPDVLASDVAEWESALERGDLEVAVNLYRGSFLQGFHLDDAPEFERWVDTVREQFTAEYRRALTALAVRATAVGRLDDAVPWWRRLAADDRVGSRAALGLMRALAEADDRAGALEFARVHERIVWAELEAAPDPAVAAFAETLRASPPRPAVAKAPPTDLAAADFNNPTDVEQSDVEQTTVEPRRVRRPWRGRGAIYAASAVVALLVVYGYGALKRERALAQAASRPGPAEATGAVGLPTSRRGRHETINIAAHEYYVRGRDPTLTRSDSAVRLAIAYLNRAIALDSTYAAAYAALAYTYATAAYGIIIPIAERRAMHERAEAAARKAVALDDSLAEAHAELGYTLMVGYDLSGAEKEFHQAIALDSSDVEPHLWLAKMYEWTGRPADAVAEVRRAMSADPVSASANAELGEALYFERRYDDALEQLRKVAALQPPLRRTPVYVAETYAAMGRWPEAIATLRPPAERDTFARALLCYAIARSGDRTEATRLLTDMRAAESAGQASAVGIAEVYAALGDSDRAFVWLDRSFDDYSLSPSFMGPLFAGLHADPRFERVRRRLGLRPAGRAARD